MRLHTRKIPLLTLALVLAACGASLPARPASSPPPLPVEPTPTVSAPISETAPATSTPDPTPVARPSEASDETQPPLYRLRAGELTLAADIDAIPAIFASDDLFVSAQAGSREWPDEELVIGVLINDEARAYPIRLLSLHEIVNDVVGGRPVAVTWCPLCFSALVFSREVGRELTFGVSGFLFKENLVMYDHQTNTLWSQLLAQGIRGALRGEQLSIFPSLITSWGDWKRAQPETRVLSAERLGNNADEIIDPYAGYYTADVAGLTNQEFEDDLLRAKALVVGVIAGDHARAYPLETVAELGLINDRVGELPVLMVFDSALESVHVFRNRVDGQELTFMATEQPGLVQDQETGSVWEIRTGRAVRGSLAGSRLARLSAPLVFWFAWSDFHPSSDVFAP